MLRYISTRLLYMVPVLWLVVSVVFLLIHLVPGDPIQQMLGKALPPPTLKPRGMLMAWTYPWAASTSITGRACCTAILGRSLRFDQPVTRLVLQRYPETMRLTLASHVCSVANLHSCRCTLSAKA